VIRVLLVDDSTFVRKAMRRVLEADPEIQVVGEADDGRRALDLVQELDPHVVALDVEMPELDGYSTLCQIMGRFPRPVLMLSSHTRKGAELTLRCLEVGAVDFLDKSAYGAMDYHRLAEELRNKVRAAGCSLRALPSRAVAPVAILAHNGDAPAGSGPVAIRKAPGLVVIGASTGGPPVLQAILAALPENFPAPVLVVQHMPRGGFTRSFAERLDSLCRIGVAEAAAGTRLRPGTALVAPAGRRLRVAKAAEDGLQVQLSAGSGESQHTPSIDEAMGSAAVVAAVDGLGILLTGMGNDGAAGLLSMRRAGALTIVQSPDTCVAVGMPRSALDRGAAASALSPDAITALLLGLAV
jgi:two-component system, chemotaxis family, protein-glutamate methylesterase/glutaminase